jgi:aminopeptidase-like protein
MPSMMQILADLTPLNRVVCSDDYDKTIEYMKKVLPFEELSFSHDEAYNGWVIPPKWNVREAKILRNGKVIYDGTWHPMAVIALSIPFRGKVSREELRQHLHYDHRYDDSIPFHFRQLFRSWNRDWGFCVPKRFYDALEPGDYEVIIETDESPGTLRMLEFTLPGRVEETIVFGTNLDHPGVSNDGLAGVVVGIELFRRLAKRSTNFTYRLVLPQGIIGTEFYLGKQAPERRKQLLEGVMLEMLGSRTELALQHSRSGSSNIEYALEQVLKTSGVQHRVGAFESWLLNDEYIWEAYGIPMASLSRFPYPEYHSDRDNVTAISESALNEAVDVLEKAIDIVECSPLVTKRFEGILCLSNPQYDLYIDPGQVVFGDGPDETRRRMRLLMDTIPTITRPVTIRQIAEMVELPIDVVAQYLEKWRAKGLIDIRGNAVSPT